MITITIASLVILVAALGCYVIYRRRPDAQPGQPVAVPPPCRALVWWNPEAAALPANHLFDGILIGIGLFGLAASYFLPMLWDNEYAHYPGGLAFVLCSLAGYLDIRRRQLGGCWRFHYHLYHGTQEPDGARRWRELSSLVTAVGFSAVFFTPFFRHLLSAQPGLALFMFTFIWWLIATGSVARIIEKITRWFGWPGLITAVGITLILALHAAFYDHIEQRMGAILFFAVVSALVGAFLPKGEDEGQIAVLKKARRAFYAVATLGVISVVGNVVSALTDHPWKQSVDQVRAYQKNEREDLDVRWFPPTKQQKDSEREAARVAIASAEAERARALTAVAVAQRAAEEARAATEQARQAGEQQQLAALQEKNEPLRQQQAERESRRSSAAERPQRRQSHSDIAQSVADALKAQGIWSQITDKVTGIPLPEPTRDQ